MRSRLVVTNVECYQKLRRAFKRHKSRRYWVAKYQAYKQSGLGPGKFCQSHGLAKSSFYRWFGRLEAEGVLEGNFIPVEVEDSPVALVEDDVTEPILPDSLFRCFWDSQKVKPAWELNLRKH